MISFENDYNKGAHPAILEAFARTNLEPCSGYGNDPYCASAADKIRQACACPEAEVAFISGGTQTNAVVISSMLREYEGVIAATTGHISLHEAGAIECTGHKVLEIPEENGKLTVLPYGKMIFVFKDHAEGQTLKLTLKTPDRKLSKEESQVYYQMRPDDELFEAEWL